MIVIGSASRKEKDHIEERERERDVASCSEKQLCYSFFTLTLTSLDLLYFVYINATERIKNAPMVIAIEM